MLLPLIKIKTETSGILQQPMIQLERIMTEDRTLVQSLSTNFAISSTPTPVSMPILPVSFSKPIPPISVIHLLTLIFMIGCFINICLLIRSHISLYLLIRNGKKETRDGYTIVLLDNPVTPFNYGRFIILSEKDYGEHQKPILTHEIAHFRLLHSFDILMMELLSLLQWFNPVVRLLKKEIRSIHEFQADAEVLKTGVDATNYQLLLMKKAVDSGTYAFANSLNNSKLKIRITMMTKKKSNSWARLKFLLLLPVAALSVYAFARPDGTRYLEQIMRCEELSISSNDPDFTLEFFEKELNKFISETGGNVAMSATEKIQWLIESTNIVDLRVNSLSQIMLSKNIGTIDQLVHGLTKNLVADYPNQKPVLISMQTDRAVSVDSIYKIFSIVGKVFNDNEELLKQKKQPVLLHWVEPKSYKLVTSVSGNKNETYPVHISFFKSGEEPRNYTFTYKNAVQSSFVLDNAETINEIKELISSLKEDELKNITTSIKAHADTPIGVIMGIKQLLRELHCLKMSY